MKGLLTFTFTSRPKYDVFTGVTHEKCFMHHHVSFVWAFASTYCCFFLRTMTEFYKYLTYIVFPEFFCRLATWGLPAWGIKYVKYRVSMFYLHLMIELFPRNFYTDLCITYLFVKFRLSDKHKKFEKIFLMVLTN